MAQAGTYADYVTHHNGPQYFGYIGDNPSGFQPARTERLLHCCREAAAAGERRVLRAWRLRQPDGLKPLDPNPTVQANFAATTTIRVIPTPRSPKLCSPMRSTRSRQSYWKDSAIIITTTRRMVSTITSRRTSAASTRKAIARGRAADPGDRDLAVQQRAFRLARVQRAQFGNQVHRRAVQPDTARQLPTR